MSTTKQLQAVSKLHILKIIGMLLTIVIISVSCTTVRKDSVLVRTDGGQDYFIQSPDGGDCELLGGTWTVRSNFSTNLCSISSHSAKSKFDHKTECVAVYRSAIS